MYDLLCHSMWTVCNKLLNEWETYNPCLPLFIFFPKCVSMMPSCLVICFILQPINKIMCKIICTCNYLWLCLSYYLTAVTTARCHLNIMISNQIAQLIIMMSIWWHRMWQLYFSCRYRWLPQPGPFEKSQQQVLMQKALAFFFFFSFLKS